MEKKNIIQWCQRAAKDIRYRPDREAVTLELYHHAEDHYDTLIEKGLSPADAEAKVLEAMGSAEEIAPQLGEIHSPWLGRLYCLVRFFAVITVVFALYLWVMNIGGFIHTLITTRNFDSIPVNHPEASHYWQPKVSDWCDGYRFEVVEAGYKEGDDVLYFDLQVTYWPWMEPCIITDLIWAVDSLGNHYDSRADATYDAPSFVASSSGMYTSMIFIRNMKITGFDSAAEWVELHYDRDGRDFVLRIDMPGGGESE